MVVIVAGYTIEQDELVRFLEAQGWGAEPDEPELTVTTAWMQFIGWRASKPLSGDRKNLLPWVQYWYDKNGNHVHAFMTKRSREVSNLKLRFKELPKDRDIRDKFIADTGNVLDPNKMKFWSLPDYVLHIPLDPNIY